ncbi:hypothetical protein XELAEV_18014552mg [Xenopus laevis]|uniref:CREG-like beta-barrel domain-containing protein n=1 Tax=Xenopus laevis TaxID=8355 RepID=A0A974DJ16_XENLA|nr:hypothetical protein XELAEV_18014552mg [Xenopus laevis]
MRDARASSLLLVKWCSSSSQPVVFFCVIGRWPCKLLPPCPSCFCHRECPVLVNMTPLSGLVASFFLLQLLIAPGSPSPFPPRNETARVARYVAHHCDWGALATISSHSPVQGQPFANVFSVSDGPKGAGSGVPYLYLTNMEISVQDLQVRRGRGVT